MRSRLLAGALGLAAAVAASGAIACVVAVGWTFTDALEAFVVSNILIGVSFGLCGALIAWHQPSSALGWMYAVGGSCQASSALAAPLAELLHDGGAAEWVVRLDATVFQWAWPVNITLLPISLLLLPDGHLASRRWRPVAIAVAVTAPLFVLEIGLGPEHPPGLPPAYLTLGQSTYDSLSWLWTISEVRWALSVVIGVVCLFVRYRRGDEVVRRQLLWLVAAAAVIVVAVIPWALVAGTPLGRAVHDPAAAGSRRRWGAAPPAARHPAGRGPRAHLRVALRARPRGVRRPGRRALRRRVRTVGRTARAAAALAAPGRGRPAALRRARRPAEGRLPGRPLARRRPAGDAGRDQDGAPPALRRRRGRR